MSEDDEENNQEEINNNEIEDNYNENINLVNQIVDNNYFDSNIEEKVDNNFSEKKTKKKKKNTPTCPVYDYLYKALFIMPTYFHISFIIVPITY